MQEQRLEWRNVSPNGSVVWFFAHPDCLTDCLPSDALSLMRLEAKTHKSVKCLVWVVFKEQKAQIELNSNFNYLINVFYCCN